MPTPEQKIMQFLHDRVFGPVMNSPEASADLKAGARLTANRMQQLDAAGLVQYFWSSVIGTERSIDFAAKLKNAGFVRFEEVIDDFRERFSRPIRDP